MSTYDPARGDVILNPFDSRCAAWSIFSDLRTEIDYTTIASFFVPQQPGESDPVWTNASRLLLEDVFKIVQLDPGFYKTMGQVAKIIMTMGIQELSELLKKHELPSSGAFSAANAKASESIRMTLTSQPELKFFKLFDAPNPNFSLRSFVESESTGWIFITSHPEMHEAIKPFAAAWLEIAMLAAMSGRPVNDTRVMFFIDELASLPRLKALETGLTQARKFGISSVLGFQNIAQLEHIYSREMSRVLIANTQTKVIFRTEDEASARILSDTLGKSEIDEASGGLQFGIESTRDSSQISRKRSEINVVLPSEMQTLADLTAFLKVAGSYPVAQIKIPIVQREIIADAYVLKTKSETTGAQAEVKSTEPVAVQESKTDNEQISLNI